MHELFQLLANGSGPLQGGLIERMLESKCSLLAGLVPLRVHGKERKVVTVCMEQWPRRLVRLTLPLGRHMEERRIRGEHGDDTEYLSGALELPGREQKEAKLRVDGQCGQPSPGIRERPGTIQSTDLVQEFAAFNKAPCGGLSTNGKLATLSTPNAFSCRKTEAASQRKISGGVCEGIAE